MHVVWILLFASIVPGHKFSDRQPTFPVDPIAHWANGTCPLHSDKFSPDFMYFCTQTGRSTTKPKYIWYWNSDGAATRCYGKPRTIVTREGDIYREVDHCDKFPGKIRLKD